MRVLWLTFEMEEESEIREEFARYDSDNNGTITKAKCLSYSNLYLQPIYQTSKEETEAELHIKKCFFIH